MTYRVASDIEPSHPLVDDEQARRNAVGMSRLPGDLANERRPKPLKASAGRPGPLVSKTMVNFVVDASLLVLVVALLFTAAVLRFVFPAPSTSAGWTLWGRGYDAWANFQFALAAIIGLAILLHVMLHWSWVCGVVATRLFRRTGVSQKIDDGQQTLWGVGMLIVVVNILGLLVGLAYLTIRSPGD